MPSMAYIISHRVPTLVALVLVTLVSACAVGPPVQEMSNARQAIRAARDAGAAQTSSEAFKEAERLLGQAESQLQEGDYKSARRDAVAARSKAAEALRHARSQRPGSSG